MLKVNDTCIGCGACVAIAPENFDYAEGVSVVTNETITEKTKEAVYFIVDYLKKNFNCPVAFYSSNNFGSESYAEQVKWFIENKDGIGIHIFDLYFDEDFNKNVFRSASPDHLPDTVHPNSAGYNILSPIIEDWMKTL